jgi:hypothetical protein
MKEENGGVGLRLCRRGTGVLKDVLKERLMGGNGSSLWLVFPFGRECEMSIARRFACWNVGRLARSNS